MLNASSKRVKHAETGDNIFIPIAQPDKINSLVPRNILACITEKGESTYLVGMLSVELSLSSLTIFSLISFDNR